MLYYLIISVFGLISATIFTLLTPLDSLAWGPATHLELARTITANPAIFPAVVRTLIERFPSDFYYGNIGADIVVGKNMMSEIKHCHNWNFGFKLLKRAKTDPERAFSYGYLTHLAADTVAHNYFIPTMLVRSFSSIIHRHIYWEMRFDSLVDKKIWQMPEKIEKEVHQTNDALLSATLEGTPLSFRTNKTIFTSVLNLHRIEGWHKMIAHLSKDSKWALTKEDHTHYLDLALTSATELLQRGKDAKCTLKDPTGKENLSLARSTQKKLKTLKRKGKDYDEPLKEALGRFSV